jgi:isochorismate synthase
MNKGKQNNHTIIEHLLKNHTPFAAWRIPGEKVFHIVQQSMGDVCLLNDISELNGQQGFVIAPFKIDSQHPIVLIKPKRGNDTMTLCNNEKIDFLAAKVMSEEPVIETACDTSYSHHFSLFMKALKNGEFEKLVLSRCDSSVDSNKVSPTEIFYSACRSYIHSYIYICYTPQTGIWIGSSPEILISGSQNMWHTVALAGTQRLVEGNLPRQWDDKNRKEQEYVASYIRHILRYSEIEYIEKEPQSVYAGSLAHLKSNFYFAVDDTSKVCGILNMLHPTPAVCGLPKNKAYQFIIDNEGYDRSYYSGFIGWLDLEGQTDLYVNLRCMNISDTNVKLYAGGGLLSSSKEEDEWLETEHKLQTMKRLINKKI